MPTNREAQGEVERIVAGLTDAQRRAILGGRWIHPGGQNPIFLVDFTEVWNAPIAQFFTLSVDRLNALGIAVRQALQTQEPDHG